MERTISRAAGLQGPTPPLQRARERRRESFARLVGRSTTNAVSKWGIEPGPPKAVAGHWFCVENI